GIGPEQSVGHRFFLLRKRDDARASKRLARRRPLVSDGRRSFQTVYQTRCGLTDVVRGEHQGPPRRVLNNSGFERDGVEATKLYQLVRRQVQSHTLTADGAIVTTKGRLARAAPLSLLPLNSHKPRDALECESRRMQTMRIHSRWLVGASLIASIGMATGCAHTAASPVAKDETAK